MGRLMMNGKALMLERLMAGGEGMVGWLHQLNEHDFEQTPGVIEGWESLVCYSPWGCKESDMTEQLNNKFLH